MPLSGRGAFAAWKGRGRLLKALSGREPLAPLGRGGARFAVALFMVALFTVAQMLALPSRAGFLIHSRLAVPRPSAREGVGCAWGLARVSIGCGLSVQVSIRYTSSLLAVWLWVEPQEVAVVADYHLPPHWRHMAVRHHSH